MIVLLVIQLCHVNSIAFRQDHHNFLPRMKICDRKLDRHSSLIVKTKKVRVTMRRWGEDSEQDPNDFNSQRIPFRLAGKSPGAHMPLS